MLFRSASARAALAGLPDPFPGLRPFESEEEAIFRGRQQNTDELLRRLSERRFLAVVGTSGSGKSSLLKVLTREVRHTAGRVLWKGRSVRALNPLSKEDAALLEAVNSGKFMLNGFRNRELRALLYGETKNKQQERRESASVTRQMRMLRAHGMIEKVRKENRYKVTKSGHQTIAALLSARAANNKKLLDAA